MDRRIGPHFLQAGIGYGGSCFPKDVSALKQIAGNSGYHFQLLNAVIEVNELQKRRVIGKLKRHLGDELRGKRIALLGLAFKPNTDDIRQASSIVLAGRLLAEGASVVGYDPVATDNMRAMLPTMELRRLGHGRPGGRRRLRAGDGVGRVRRARLGSSQGGHGPTDRHRRAQRPGWRSAHGPRIHLRGCGDENTCSALIPGNARDPWREAPGANRPSTIVFLTSNQWT